MNQERTLPKARRMLPALATAAVLAASATALPAASGYWTSTSDGDWANAGNWKDGNVPGSATDTGNRDSATFNKGSGYQFTVFPDAGRIVGTILFDQAGAGNAGNYVIGATDGPPLGLAGISSGFMQVNASLTTPDITETVNAPLVLYSTYQFINSSPAPTTTLRLAGSICSGTNANVQIHLKGTNTGPNLVSGVISNGASSVSILKPQGISSSGMWLLSGANTYTGTTAVSIGTLVAATDAPSGAPGAFGNATSAVTIGDSTSTAVNNASLLAGYGATACTIGRPVTVQALASGKVQTATLGGANTAGTSSFTGNLSLNRDVILLCATGGTVAFSTGTWTARDKAFTIGSPANLGTVRIDNPLGTTGGVSVAYGTLAVAGRLAGGVSVADGAALTGSGAIVSNGVATAVTVAGGGTLDPGSIGGLGTLSVTGNVTFASGGRFAVQAQGSGADLLKVAGSVTATDPVVVATAPDDAFGPWLVMSASSIDPAFEDVSLPSGLVLSLKQGGTALWLSRTRGTLLMLH